VLLGSIWAPAFGQVTGKVFRDFNANGRRDSTATTAVPYIWEAGVPRVTVKATRPDNSTVAVQTDNFGNFRFTSAQLANGTHVRLEFSGLLPQDFPGMQGVSSGGSGTSVQFVVAGLTTVANYGVNYAADYCVSQSNNPLLITPCYVSGDPMAGGTAGTLDVLVGVPYYTTGAPAMSAISHLAYGRDMGSVYGVAYQRETRSIFTSAYLKRHVGLGSGGLGAIYLTKLTPTQSVESISLFANLTDLGFNVGSVARTTTPTSATTTLPGSATAQSYDSDAFDKVGKAGLGDLDLSDDGRELYTINLFTRELYRITVGNPAVAPTASDIRAFPIPDPSCPGSTFRPFALKYWRGKVYVGGVCTNENRLTASSQPDTTGMKATVYEFDGTNFTTVLQFPLTYNKGATSSDRTGAARGEYWLPWTNTIRNTARFEGNLSNTIITYSQPMLADLEFDVDGSMIIGLRDRFGDQMGNVNLGLSAADARRYTAITPGDILRAGRCGSANQWTLENRAGICGSPAPSLTVSVNAPNGTPFVQQAVAGHGPGGGEFYFGDVVQAGTNHHESSMGSLALWPGQNQVVVTAIDPADVLYTGGYKKLSNTTGWGSRLNGTQLYSSTTSTFGKANGLGDIEVACDPDRPPIEIGNRVWNDHNRNGIQDPGEPGIDGVVVELYESGVKVAETLTANGGQYFFRTTSATGQYSLKYNTAYQVRVPSSQTALVGFALASANQGDNDLLDSDAQSIGGNAFGMSLQTGNAGETDHRFDFGFQCVELDAGPDRVLCSGQTTLDLADAGANASWSLAEDNPPGVQIDPATGLVQGMQSGLAYRFTLTTRAGCMDMVRVDVRPAPNLTPATLSPACSGTAVVANGRLTVSGDLAGVSYQFSVGSSFNTAAAVPASAQAVPTNGILSSNLSAAGPYTIRFTVDSCTYDRTVTLAAPDCGCPTICLPVTITRVR